MSRRKRSGRRPATQSERNSFLAALATKTGQSVEDVAEHIRAAVEHGWLIETRDGWQAAIPAKHAPDDWTGPIT